jgi:hypothetical protein
MAVATPAATKMFSEPAPDTEMVIFDSLCDYANNMSLQDETAADLVNELVVRGASQSDVAKWAPSSVQHLHFTRRSGGGTVIICKGCGQQSSKKHKCHSSSQGYWSKLLTTGGGWAAAFKALDRRGWWLELSPEQADKARKLRDGAPKAAIDPKRPITNSNKYQTTSPQKHTFIEGEYFVHIPGRGVQLIAGEAGRGVPFEGDSYVPEYADHGPPSHSIRRAVFDEPRRSRRATLPPLSDQKSRKDRQRARRRARVEAEQLEQPEGKKNINPTQMNKEQLIGEGARRSQRLVDRQRISATTAAATPPVPAIQHTLPQFDFSTIQSGIHSLSLG